MRSMRLAKVAYAAVLPMLVACSSNGTVVAVNVLSSNDTQYNGDTLHGSRGGLLDPGIPDSILHPNIPTASNELRKAAMVRITITSAAGPSVMRDVMPAKVTFKADVLDAAGMPVLDAMGKVTQTDHSAIARFYTRFTLDDAWKDGPATVTAEALDATGNPFFSAAVPPTIMIKENQAVAAFPDFVIPSPAAAASDGGSADSGGGDGGGDGSPGDSAGNDGGGDSALGDAGDAGIGG
jgi:hypothetical protein